MQISIETMTGLERRLTISVPSQTFEGQVTERLGKAAGQLRLPGFRPGKIPMKEVRRRYGPSVRAEIAGELMQTSFYSAIRDEEIVPAGSPSLELVKMDPGIDFEFIATFEIFPTVELSDLSKLSVQEPSAEIVDPDVDAMIERLREQRQTWEVLDTPCAEGHRVTVDFSGAIDGEPFEGGQGEGASFVIGAGQMIADFDRGVLGMRAGEEGDFPAEFPDDYQSEELQGKTASFHVNVSEVAASQRPDLDDEFFREFGIEEGGIEAFREDVQANMQREMDAAILNQVKTQVMDQLHASHKVQLPQTMIKGEIDALKEQMLQQFQMYGANQQPPELPDDMFTEQAERRVSVGLVIKEIVARAELEADADRVRARIETLAAQYGEPEQVVNWYYSNQEQLQQIEMAVLEEQVVDHVLQAATVESVTSSYDDIIAGKAVKVEQSDEPDEVEDGQSVDN